jgi:cytochrome c oxidase assembly protein subunit 15
MGCPDWPKCFGQWIPPTHESQLPTNYKIIYADRGYDTITFNPVKTWIEYVNRLTGMLIGLAVIATLITAILSRLSIAKKTLSLSGLVVALVGFQGWLGSTVVSSLLAPKIITIHMIVAIIIIMILNIIIALEMPHEKPGTNRTLLVASAATLIQFVIGSQVRQAVDHGIGLNNLTEIGNLYLIHRSFSWIVGISLIVLAIQWNRSGHKTLSLLLLLPLSIQIGSGLIFSQLGLIPLLQPLHLTAAAVTIGSLTYAWTPSKS